MIHEMGTHHKAMITWNISIAVRAMKTLTGSQRMLHTPVPSKQHSCCVWNSHSGAKTRWTRGASTPPFVTVLMTVKIHVLTLRPTPVLGSHHPLDAPHPMLRRRQCCAPSSSSDLFGHPPRACWFCKQHGTSRSIRRRGTGLSVCLDEREKTQECHVGLLMRG